MNLNNEVKSDPDTQNELTLWNLLGRMEAKLDTVIDMEKRVRSLEVWRGLLVGAWGLLTILVTVALTLLSIYAA